MGEPNPNRPGPIGTDARLAEVEREPAELEARRRAICQLREAGVPFLVGGAYASAEYTGLYRDTKDLDLFVRERDGLAALGVLERHGWRTQAAVYGWLHKAWWGDYLVDLIFGSGSGITVVDDAWFEHARRAEVLGCACLVPPAEEIIWSKAFVLERERYDGAELNHLFLRAGRSLDWARLLRRFERHWEVLLGHLMLFRFSYPSERAVVPDWLMRELFARGLRTVDEGPWERRVCRGLLSSEVNYRVDVEEWGFEDGRDWEAEQQGLGRQRRAEGEEPSASPPSADPH